ncbi:MAG: hypothetical protein ACKVWR_15485 [Acidimicrobiales bacterium]
MLLISALGACTTPAAGPGGGESAPSAAGPTWEQVKDAEIPGLCTHPPTRLVDGQDVSLGPLEGRFRLLTTLADGGPAWTPDLRSRAGEAVTAVVAECDAGGAPWPHLVLYFDQAGRYRASTAFEEYDWAALGLAGPARNGVTRVAAAADGRLEVDLLAERPGDASCCPSGAASLVASLVDSTVVVD